MSPVRRAASVAAPGSLAIAAVLVFAPFAGAASFGSFGSFVDTPTAKDLVPSLVTPGTDKFCIGYVDDPNNPGDKSKRAWFFHIATDGTCDATEEVSNTRTFRYTAYGGTSSLKWITTTDTTYINKVFTAIKEIAAGETSICYLEADGLSGFTIGDPVYVDTETFDGGANGVLTLNDFRLVRVSSTEGAYTGFSTPNPSIVKTITESDIRVAGDATDDPTKLPISDGFVASGGACGGFSVKALDLGTRGTFDSQDNFYLIGPGPLSTTRVHQGITRLTTGPGGTGGTKVLDGNQDHRDFLQYIASSGGGTGVCGGGCGISLARVAGDTPGDPTTDKLFIHWPDPDGTNDDILINDLTVKRSNSASAGSQGQLVTTATAGAGSTIVGGTLYALEDLFYFLDLDGDMVYTDDEPVFIKHPTNVDADIHGGDCTATGTERCIQIDDIRVRAISGQTMGSAVKAGDTDLNSYKTTKGYATGFVKIFSSKQDTDTPLKTVTNSKYWDKDKDNIWDPATEDVFIGAMTNDSDATTYNHVWTGGGGTDAAITCPAFGMPCGGTNLKAGKVKVSGPDSTWDKLQSELIYWSDDADLQIGDYRLGAPGAPTAGQVASGDADVDQPRLQNTGVHLYVSFDPGCPGACFDFPRSGDVRLNSFGQVLTSTSAEVVPQVTVVTPRLVRHDYGDPGNINDDTLYLDFGTSFTASEVMRITPFSSRAAGTFLTDSDTTETGATHMVDSNADASDDVGFIESGTLAGLDAKDSVYMNLEAALGGTAGKTLTAFDSRLTKYMGTTTLNAGSFVKTSDNDITTFGGNALGGTWKFLHWDANRNGRVDKDDNVWLHQGTDTPTTPGFLDVRLSGTATVSSGGGGGGGGASPPPPSVIPASITIAQPASGYLKTGSSNTISGTATAGSTGGVANTITSITLVVNGVTQTVTGTSSWSATYTPATDGTYTVTATVTPSSGSAVSATRTFTANAAGAAPGTTPPPTTCPDGTTVPAGESCPATDPIAREEAQEAKELAEEAREAAERAEETASEANDAAQGAKDAAERNSQLADEVLQSILDRAEEGDGDGVPGPGALVALVTVGLAALVARRRRLV